MITEDYVSFEIAKLLKEKGFDEKCHRYWQYDKANDKDDVDGICLNYCSGVSGLNNSELDIFFGESLLNFGYSAPTLQMAMKWLRVEKDIQIEITIVGVEWENPTKWYYGFRCQNKEYIDRHDANLTSYEEACEAAIKHCLEKLI